MDNNIELTSGQVLSSVHSKVDCMGEYCALHKPSNHKYNNYPLFFNRTLGIWERISPINNRAVPDPDNLAFQNGNGYIIYENKIQCIECFDTIESTHRHDYVTCSCSSVAVDGGNRYLRRVGDHYIERSITVINPLL